MKRLLLSFLFLILGVSYSFSQGQQQCWTSNGTNCIKVGTGGGASPLPVTATITPSGTQDVNISQIQGAVPSLTNPLWIIPATGATFTLNAETTKVIGTVNQGTSPWIISGTVTQGTASNLNATVVGTGTFATQSAITAASGAFVSGSQPIGITPTDHTLTSASGSSQTLMNALSTRKGLTINNSGNANCGVNPTGGTAVIGGAGTLTLVPNGSYSPRIPTLSAVTVICTTGQPLYAAEY